MTPKTLTNGVLVGLCLLVASAAHATLLNFDLNWSGASFGNNATATGMITIDDRFFNNPGTNNTSAIPWATDFMITVSGSGEGDGTWSMIDYRSLILDTGGVTLDLTTELVGQPTVLGPWGGRQVCCGDFNIFRTPISTAPEGVDRFTVALGPGFNSPWLALTSFRPVPEPTTLALLSLGLAGLGFTRRKMKT